MKGLHHISVFITELLNQGSRWTKLLNMPTLSHSDVACNGGSQQGQRIDWAKRAAVQRLNCTLLFPPPSLLFIPLKIMGVGGDRVFRLTGGRAYAQTVLSPHPVLSFIFLLCRLASISSLPSEEWGILGGRAKSLAQNDVLSLMYLTYPLSNTSLQTAFFSSSFFSSLPQWKCASKRR